MRETESPHCEPSASGQDDNTKSEDGSEDGSEDERFDRTYPFWVRKLSGEYWTPVAVAKRAAELLVTGPKTRVLDIGSGSGKFCIIGALATGANFYGVEQDKRLVDVARKVGQRHQAEGAHFMHGDAKDLDWQEYDAFYFFNPFAEYWNRVKARNRRATQRRRDEDVGFAEHMLRALPAGTRVVTYHGFGDQMPLEYRRRSTDFFGKDRLELWVKEE